MWGSYADVIDERVMRGDLGKTYLGEGRHCARGGAGPGETDARGEREEGGVEGGGGRWGEGGASAKNGQRRARGHLIRHLTLPAPKYTASLRVHVSSSATQGKCKSRRRGCSPSLCHPRRAAPLARVACPRGTITRAGTRRPRPPRGGSHSHSSSSPRPFTISLFVSVRPAPAPRTNTPYPITGNPLFPYVHLGYIPSAITTYFRSCPYALPQHPSPPGHDTRRVVSCPVRLHAPSHDARNRPLHVRPLRLPGQRHVSNVVNIEPAVTAPQRRPPPVLPFPANLVQRSS